MITYSEMIRELKVKAAQIVEQAKSGNEMAQRVIDLYQMHYSCPSDPGAKGLLIAAYEEWRNKAKK